MNTTISGTTTLSPKQPNSAPVASTSASVAARISEQQAALRQALTARRAAEVRLENCKTRTSPAAKQHKAEMDTQQTFADSLLAEIKTLSREPEATALAAYFGARRLARYVVIDGRSRDILDIQRINAIRIAFFTIAKDGGMTEFIPQVYWLDDPITGERVGVEVK